MEASEPAPAAQPAVPEPESSSAPLPSDATKSTAAPQALAADAINTLWGHMPWISPTSGSAPEETAANNMNPNIGSPIPPAWLTGAGALFSDAVQGAGAAVAAAGEKLRAVDQSALEGGIESLRVASDQLVRDVSQGVKELTTPVRVPSAESGSASVTPAALLETLRAGTREALELFVDSSPGANAPSASVPPAPAPWDESALPERERRYASALRERMLKLVVDAIYSRKRREALFLSGRARKDGFSFDAERNLNRALAVLEADPNVKRLRAGLVPAKVAEKLFWDEYFWHVRHARRLLVAHHGVIPEEESMDAGGGAAELFGKEEDVVEEAEREAEKKMENESKDEGKAGQKEGEDTRNWDDEIDAIFDLKGTT